MRMTLELPPQLGEALREDAEKAGLTVEEHARILLYLATALLNDEQETPFQHAVQTFVSHSVDAGQVASVFEKLVARYSRPEPDGATVDVAELSARLRTGERI
jgi:endonuclease III